MVLGLWLAGQRKVAKEKPGPHCKKKAASSPGGRRLETALD
jgi:hypothetical protein